MKEEHKEYPEADYLYEHPGTERYEVVGLVSKGKITNINDFSSETPMILFDTAGKKMFTETKNTTYDKKINYKFLKFDINGRLAGEGETNVILNDGTIWYKNYFSNWIINGDTEMHSYISPLSENEAKKEKKWLNAFEELYANADYVYLYMSIYYFKVRKKWYMLNNDAVVVNPAFKAKYPAKEDNDVRMIELEDLCPSFWSNPKTRDVSLIRELDYEVVDFEKGKGLNPINYSAGNYYFEVYMPGETITFKRYGAMGEHIKLYKIPTEYGGREDVLFIVLEPRNSDARQASGMYVIRPREIAKEKEAAL